MIKRKEVSTCITGDHVSQFFVDAKDRASGLKKARKEIHETFPRGTVHIFSFEKQGFKEGRYIAWICVRKK